MVFQKLAASADRAVKPWGVKIDGISWTVLDPQFWLDQAIPKTSHRTVITLTTEQLEHFDSKRMPDESLTDAIDRIVASTFKARDLGPIYWYRPLNLSQEEAEAIVDGDGVITTKNGVSINTYERLRDGKYRIGIIHGDDAYLFTMKEIALEDGYVKIQLMKPGERIPQVAF